MQTRPHLQTLLVFLPALVLPLLQNLGPKKAFQDASLSHLPIMSLQVRSMDAHPADLDHDGDLDLLIASEFAYNVLLLNDGKGHFEDATVGRLPLARHDSEDIAIADFNGDGHLDVLFVSEDDQVNEYFFNDGTAHFTAAPFPFTGTTNGVATADLNGDGHPDLVLGNAPSRAGEGGQNLCLINDGKGGWVDETKSRLPESTKATQDLEFADIDGDDDLDLIVGNEDDNELLLNDGKGHFTDVTATHLPIRPDMWETREADFGDIDGDGDPDLVFANVNFRKTKDPQNILLRNDGTGHFQDITATHLPKEEIHTVDADFVDLDGDQDLDLVTSNSFGASYRAYRNDGEGHFEEATEEFFPSDLSGDGIDSEAADFNGDGHLDLYLTNFTGADILLLGKKGGK